jgi:DNA end-binding protein Ku
VARAIWSGVLSFGLVAVPVQLFSATEAHEPHFHQFEKGTSDRVRYQRVNERTGKEVDYSDIVKGAEVDDGNYVMIDQEELDAIAPGRSRALDVHTFVDLDEVDPVYFAKTYYLGPQSDETAKTYVLLRDALADTNRVAIASFVMRGKEYLAAVRADGDVLVLHTLFFADEVRDTAAEIDQIPPHADTRPQELKMARQLIKSMSSPWKPSKYRDTYTDRINELIEAKKNKQEITPAQEAPTATNVVDLMEALRASVEAARKGGSTGPAKKSSPRKTSSRSKTSSAGKSPGKRTATKKSSGGKSGRAKTKSSGKGAA